MCAWSAIRSRSGCGSKLRSLATVDTGSFSAASRKLGIPLPQGIVRVYKTDAGGNVIGYGNLYGNLLDYVISAALIFYILTIVGLFLLRWKRPDAERPYKAWGYPIVPALYIVGAAVILVVLFVYQTATTWPGLMIVLTGVPIYFLWKFFGEKPPPA